MAALLPISTPPGAEGAGIPQEDVVEGRPRRRYPLEGYPLGAQSLDDEGERPLPVLDEDVELRATENGIPDEIQIPDLPEGPFIEAVVVLVLVVVWAESELKDLAVEGALQLPGVPDFTIRPRLMIAISSE